MSRPDVKCFTFVSMAHSAWLFIGTVLIMRALIAARHDTGDHGSESFLIFSIWNSNRLRIFQFKPWKFHLFKQERAENEMLSGHPAAHFARKKLSDVQLKCWRYTAPTCTFVKQKKDFLSGEKTQRSECKHLTTSEWVARRRISRAVAERANWWQ